MKNILLFLLILTQYSQAQIAIGKLATDPSAIVDLSTSSKGLSVPRMTTDQRNAITTPATGLLIYNTDDADYNSYNGPILGWQDFSTGYESVNAIGDISTTSDEAATAIGMTLTPKAGTYSVLFNSQFKNTPTYTVIPGVSSTKETILGDLVLLIADLDKHFVIETPEYKSIGHTHYASYDASGVGIGSSISNDNVNYDVPTTLTIYPGAYYNGAAINFQFDSTITLDGLGDPKAKFIIKAGAAINTNIGATFKLINGAQACNIFFLATGAMSVGASRGPTVPNLEVVGNWVSRAGAIAVGIGTNFDGRILTSAGALTMGHGILKIPTGTSFVNLRSLVSFFGFTSFGAIDIVGAVGAEKTYITGNLFTCGSAFVNFGYVPAHPGPFPAGPLTIGNPAVLDGFLYNCNGPATVGETTTTENNVGSVGTFSIYKNGIEIPESTKTTKTDSVASTITLQTIATVNGTTDFIEVWWKTAAGNTLMMGNRNLTMIKVQSLP
jgi:hypothetical protein